VTLAAYLLASHVLLAIASATAWALARRTPDHHPVAWLLSWGLASDLGQSALRAWLAGYRDPSGRVLADAAPRAALALAQAFHVSWPLALAATVAGAFSGLPRGRIRLAFALALGCLTAALSLRYDAQPVGSPDALYAVTEAACSGACALLAGSWAVRAWKLGARPRTTDAVLLALIVLECALLAGPYASPDLIAHWTLAAPARWGAYLAAIVLQVTAWIRTRPGYSRP